jgi:serine/threonine-protein kinase
MSFESGSRLGAYEVLSSIGAGGMGEVYRAHDTKLGRHVAIKVLGPSFVDDPERIARFQREAQILASLNHPHIAAIYGLEEAGATQFLVLELVEGQTLADRLAAIPRSAIRIDEALAIARQIADALEAAHEKGIIHRDLKPANIALTADGQVKVLDFGLAKALGPPEAGGSGGPAQLAHSPTLTFAATQAGMILGTAAYMSPEQAKGRVADKRTDVWSFGCVLYEMLAGKRAFEGEDATEVIAAVVRGEPEWSSLPRDLPEPVRLLLKRCLEKDRRVRVSDIAVARFVLTEPIGGVAGTATTIAAKSSRSRVPFAAGLGLAAGVIVTAIAAWALTRPGETPHRAAVRFAFLPPAPMEAVVQGTDRDIAISPDGTRIVYRGGNQQQGQIQLFVRELAQLDARPLAGTTSGRLPFFSPDGRWIGFFAGEELKKVALEGGAAVSLGRVSASPRGGSWGADDAIVVAVSGRVGLMRVPAGGGEMTEVAKLEKDEANFGYPSFLPDGRSVLFTVARPAGQDRSSVDVLNLATGERKTLISGGTNGQYVNGFLVYEANRAVHAIRFDPNRLTVSGRAIPVIEQVLTFVSGAANFAVSNSGALAYIPGTDTNPIVTPRTLVWVNRSGREDAIAAPPRAYAAARLSPDGARVALDIRDQQSDIWTWDIRRETLTRLTFHPTIDMCPVWTVDGKRIIWASLRATGIPAVFWQAADGTGPVEQLTTLSNPVFPTSVTPDGTRALLWENAAGTAQDISTLNLADRGVQTLIRTPASELTAEISPDGHWMAYASNESGRTEIYVRPFPNIEGGRWQISAAGGTRPAWSRNGRELFYLDEGGAMTAVPVTTAGGAFSAGSTARLFNTKYYPGFTSLGLQFRGYDATADGQRFLMIKDAPFGVGSSRSMVVIVNWIDELKSTIPAK